MVVVGLLKRRFGWRSRVEMRDGRPVESARIETRAARFFRKSPARNGSLAGIKSSIMNCKLPGCAILALRMGFSA